MADGYGRYAVLILCTGVHKEISYFVTYTLRGE